MNHWAPVLFPWRVKSSGTKGTCALIGLIIIFSIRLGKQSSKFQYPLKKSCVPLHDTTVVTIWFGIWHPPINYVSIRCFCRIYICQYFKKSVTRNAGYLLYISSVTLNTTKLFEFSCILSVEETIVGGLPPTPLNDSWMTVTKT
jgi:hypothetical protein